MTSPYFLAARGIGGTPGQPGARQPIPTLTLESMDGSEAIRLDAKSGWILMPGATGLRMAPHETIFQAVPGAPGTNLADVRTVQRPIMLPIYAGANGNHIAFLEMMDRLYRLVDPIGKRTFRLVGQSARGTREMIVSYTSGLEGDDALGQAGLSWAKFPLNLVAHGAYAQARQDRVLTFSSGSDFVPFLGVAGGTDAPWPRALSTASIIGEGMTINVASEVAVYPTVELVGAMDSFHGTLVPDNSVDPDSVWDVEVPLGVPNGGTLRMVTNPANKSFRLDGELAADRIALGSRLSPFYPGRNTLNVVAPGANENTAIRIFWRDLYRSLF